MNVLKTTLSVSAALVLAACGNATGTYPPKKLHSTHTAKPQPSVPPATGSNAGGSSSANNTGSSGSQAAGGTSSGSAATGGSQPSTGNNTGTTPPNTGNTSGNPAGGGSTGTQPPTPPNSTAGAANANYSDGVVVTARTPGGLPINATYVVINPKHLEDPSTLPRPGAPLSGSVSGNVVGVDTKFKRSDSDLSSGTDYEHISINGVKVALLPDVWPAKDVDTGLTAEATYNVIAPLLGTGVFYKKNLAVGKSLQYSVFGLVDMDDKDRLGLKSTQQRYAFAHGDATTNMPVAGKAKYVGFAPVLHDLDSNQGIHTRDRLLSVREVRSYTTMGTVDIDVDFGSKKLEGLMTTTGKGYDDGFLAAKLAADITGNRFEGTSSDGTVIKGGFYGPNAAEVAGTFVRAPYEYLSSVDGEMTTDGFMGAFGAKKIDPKNYGWTGADLEKFIK